MCSYDTCIIGIITITCIFFQPLDASYTPVDVRPDILSSLDSICEEDHLNEQNVDSAESMSVLCDTAMHDSSILGLPINGEVGPTVNEVPVKPLPLHSGDLPGNIQAQNSPSHDNNISPAISSLQIPYSPVTDVSLVFDENTVPAAELPSRESGYVYHSRSTHVSDSTAMAMASPSNPEDDS